MREQRLGPSPWQLRWDVASTWALVWVAHPSGEESLRPELHLFLADRYGLLARHHQRLGHARRAVELDRKAEKHFRLGGGGDSPPAVAVAMPRPRARIVVDAVAGPAPSDSDDAA